MNKMKIELFKQVGQWYLVPSIIITWDRYLNGSYGIALVWLGHGIEFRFLEKK
jgi:hypothetical protein